MPASRRWILPTGVLVVTGFVVLIGMAWLLRDPFPNHGGALVFFINDTGKEVRLVSVEVGGTTLLSPAEAAAMHPVAPPSGRGSQTLVTISAPAGRQVAVVEYSAGAAVAGQRFTFAFELTALEQCDIRVRFAPQGPSASACTDHRPASYGGTVRH